MGSRAVVASATAIGVDAIDLTRERVQTKTKTRGWVRCIFIDVNNWGQGRMSTLGRRGTQK